MQAGDTEFCQCTLNLLTFSISGFPALRRELLGEEIDNSAWMRDCVQEKAPLGNWKPPLCCCFSHNKVNNGWCQWSQGNRLPKLGLKAAKSVLPGMSWLQDCTVLSLLANVSRMKTSMCLVWLPSALQILSYIYILYILTFCSQPVFQRGKPCGCSFALPLWATHLLWCSKPSRLSDPWRLP